jgi:hypothetical protein
MNTLEKNRTRLVFSVTAITLLIAVTVSCKSTPEDRPEITAYGLTEELVIGSVPMIALDMSEQTEQYASRIEFPFFEADAPVNDAINAILQSRYTEFRQSAAENYQARQDTMEAEQGQQPEEPQPYEFIFDWTNKQINHTYISLYFSSYYFTGGANGSQVCYSVNYNRETGELMTLADLFDTDNQNWLRELSETIRRQLQETLNPLNDPELTEMIDQGTGPDEKNFSVFVFDENIITIYFQKYQAAPGSCGILSIDIPRPEV